MVAYFHAKWIAMKYHLPFLYKPFPYSDQLGMDTRNVPWSKAYQFKRRVVIRSEREINPNASSTLFIVPYFPELKYELATSWKGKFHFSMDLEDPVFKQELIRCLTPKDPIPTIPLPVDRKTVGMHVRRGGGYDHKNAHLKDPIRFPPDSYFTESLSLVINHFPNEPLYVYVLTDDPHPEDLLKRYKECFAGYDNIEFACRTSGNHYDANVLTDFFTIPKFDSFIGSGSHFSVMAAKLGDYDVLIFPVHATIVDGIVTIDQIDVKQRSFILQKK